MLANVPKPGRCFQGLRRYLVDGHLGRKGGANRVAWIATRNLITDDPKLASTLMTATAQLSARCQKPVYHLIVSWKAAERPSRAQMQAVVEATLTDIGLASHQALMVGHADTANPHVHVLLNRIHPDTGRAWSDSNDYRRIERSMARQAQAMGFEMVPGRHNRSEPTQAADRKPKRAPSKGAVHLARKLGRRLGPTLQASNPSPTDPNHNPGPEVP